MTSGTASSPRPKQIRIGTKEKPPRQELGGGKEQIAQASAFQRVTTLSILDCRCNLETHFLAEHTRDEASHRVSLPAGGLHEIRPGGAGGPLQKVEDLGRFATLTGTLSVLGRLRQLCAHVGFLLRTGLLGRPGLGGRNVARLCASARAFGRGRFGDRGGGLGIRGLFWNLVHCVFSLGGDYRDHIHRSDSPRLQGKSHANHHRLTIARDELSPRTVKGGTRW
jgi:hypothetical protein